MESLLNTERQLIFCPGCAHERVAHSLDKAFMLLGFKGKEIAIVSDIGCSGLFDIFFKTNAMHGLHGRALTYATGIKISNPKINVIATMGDGGLGIGGAHFLAACRRNINITLIILNNFNFGMTGGQFSSTTPCNAQVGSGFLNKLEKPMDACEVAKAAGAPYVVRCSGYDKNLAEKIAEAVSYDGFAVMDIHGVCPGRYIKGNKLTPKMIEENIFKLPPANGEVPDNIRIEYGKHYNILAKEVSQKTSTSVIDVKFKPLQINRQEIIILGKAGQRIITAGEVLCIAGMISGLSANQKNDYPITVLRGHSISELVLSANKIGYTGIENPDIVVVTAEEGLKRKSNIFNNLSVNSIVITDVNIDIPKCEADIKTVNFIKYGIKFQDRAMACLAILGRMKKVITTTMLKSAIQLRFKGNVLDNTAKLVEKVGQVIL